MSIDMSTSGVMVMIGRLAHRVRAACRALATRCSRVSLAAVAFPPFDAPSADRVSAAERALAGEGVRFLRFFFFMVPSYTAGRAHYRLIDERV